MSRNFSTPFRPCEVSCNMSQCIGYLWSLTIAFRGQSAALAAGMFMKEDGKGESSREPNHKDSGGKHSNKAGRGPEGEVDKGKGEEIEQGGSVDDGEGEGDRAAENEVYLPNAKLRQNLRQNLKFLLYSNCL